MHATRWTLQSLKHISTDREIYPSSKIQALNSWEGQKV